MSYLFNERTLNIFTDASIKQNKNGTFVASSAAIAVDSNCIQNNYIIDSDYLVFNATNNLGELYAVYLGVLLALKYRNRYDVVNIISDSQFSIFSLSRWIWNWRNNINNGIYYNSSGSPVANQDIIIKIVNLIISSNLNVNLYHQKGHALNKVKKSKETFFRSNGIMLDDFEANRISFYNDFVDNFSRDKLIKNNKVLVSPLQYRADFNQELYKNLINQ